MISPSDTRITYFGGSGNPAVTEAIVKLQKAGFDVVALQDLPQWEPPAAAAR